MRVGDKAPDFTAETDAGVKLSLSDFRGKNVVLYFYPKDFTSGCTREALAFRDNIASIRALGAEVVGVSLDSVGTHRKFSEKCSLNFPLMSDKDKAVSRHYGTLRLGGVLTNRMTFIIDGEGTIREIYRKVDVSKHAQEVIDRLKQLKEQGR